VAQQVRAEVAVAQLFQAKEMAAMVAYMEQAELGGTILAALAHKV
jgi:hypothetical protein